MGRSTQNYFTSGELSNLCKIPRKTLLYYDKLGLIMPELIDDNGYRYYKRSQLFLLELIITLRHLNIPLKRIEEYINNKSTANYQEMLMEQSKKLSKQISDLTLQKEQLDKYIPELRTIEQVPIGKILMKELPDQYLYLSKPILDKADFKTRSAISAVLFTDLRNKQSINRHNFGYMMDNTVLNAPEKSPEYIRYYFHPLSDDNPQITCSLKPAGTYLVLYCSGVYMTHSKAYLLQLSDYCKTHNFTPISYVYVSYLKNYWLTDNTNEYIYKIEVRVK